MFKVNEIFYSLQGEGRNTGRAAVFIRFAGCNLRCSFCDTEFDSYREMSAEEIVDAISVWPSRFVVLTGGEPTLQVDDAFVDLLHQHGYEVAMESNGTRPAPRNLDWLTVSPKDWCKASGGWWTEHRSRINEVKIVFDEDTPARLSSTHNPQLIIQNSKPITLYSLQPCDTGDAERNVRILHLCIEYIKQHPQWRLSLQTHKLVGIR